jgi:hypothetical protein
MKRHSGLHGRAAVSAVSLHALLAYEFERRRDGRCRTCRVPVPVFREPLEVTGANWQIEAPPHCPYGCHAVLAQVHESLADQFELRVSDDRPEPGD